MRKLLLIVTALAVVLSSFLSPYVAHASSAYDAVYKTEDSAWMDDYSAYNGDCMVAQDWTTSYLSYFTDSSKYLTEDGHVPTHAAIATELDSYKRAVSNGGDWAVSIRNVYTSTTSSGTNIIDLLWTESHDLKLSWATSSVQAAGKNGALVHHVQFGIDDNDYRTSIMGCRMGVISVHADTTENMTLSNTTSFQKLPDTQTIANNAATRSLMANISDTQYPAQYAGQVVKKTFNPEDQGWFKYKINVADKHLTVTPDATMKTTCFTYNATIFKKDTPALDAANTVDGSLTAVHGNEPIQLDVPANGDYSILVSAQTPTPCATTYSDFLKLVAVKVDGTTFTVNSTAMNCIGDVCSAPSPLEDCSVYGTDLIAGFGCQIRNLFTSLRGMLLSLFVPNAATMKTDMDDLWTVVEDKLGFLLYPFDFLHSMFTAFGSDGTWCTPSDCALHLNFMYGGHLDYDFLGFKHSEYAPVWDYGLLAIRAFSTLALVGMLYRKFFEVIKL